MSEGARPVQETRWQFAGPVARAYEFDQRQVAGCVGPTGGGKTTVSARRCLRAALWQHPSPRDGVRRARIYVVCPTYRIAWDSVIPSYLKVMDRPWGKWNGAKGDPADHVIQTTFPGVGPLELEVKFRAVQDNDLDTFFRGKECTGFWLPEADTHPSESILSYCMNRSGRYPEPDDRPENPTTRAWRGLFFDANAPIIGSWFHRRFYEAEQEGERLHRQPPGYDPDSPDGFHPLAENKANLAKISPTYYRDMAATMEAPDVARLLQCKPGYGRAGEPVHPEFDETVHVSKTPLEPNPDETVVIGVDAGLKGAAAFKQRSMYGHWRQLAEISAAHSPNGEMDLIEFAKTIKFIMNTRFMRCSRAIIIIDPAAKSRSSMNKALSWAAVLQHETGIQVVLAPTNDPTARRSALKRVLKRRGGYLIDGAACPHSAAALAGGFHYPRRAGKTSNIADKGDYSHIGEAIEYGVLGGEGLEERAGLIPMGLHGASELKAPEVVFD